MKNRITYTLCLIFPLILFAGLEPKDGIVSKQNSISFQENKGQVCDQYYKPRPDVLFSGNAGGMVFHLRNNGISYQLSKVKSWKEEEILKSHEKVKVADKIDVYRVDVNWLGLNKNFTIEKDEALGSYSNYYNEVCPYGVNNVQSFRGVVYKNIYKKIDLHYYEKEGQLKYDYIVRPGGNYKTIEFEIVGASKISINSEGELIINTPFGVIKEAIPLVNQNGKTLDSKWRIIGNKVSFDIKNVNVMETFTIDPLIRLWGTYYGGSQVEYGLSCAVDSMNNVYMSGWTESTLMNVIATTGSHQTAFGGTRDAFLVKLDPNGVRLWGTYYGDSGNEHGNACAIDSTGNVYLTGVTSSTGTSISSSGCHQAAYGGSGDVFLVKFNSSGVRKWGTYYGGASGDGASSCCVDRFGNVFIAGVTSSSTGISTGGCHQPIYGGGNDAFLVKFDSLGVRQWGTYYGGYAYSNAYGMSVDNQCNVIMCGFVIGDSTLSTVGSFQPIPNDPYEAFLAKFNSSGVLQWGTYCGGNANDYGYACPVDQYGNIFFAGTTGSIGSGTAIASAGSHQPLFGGATDGFLIKFNSGGVRQWGTFYGGATWENLYYSNVDRSGNVCIVGTTASPSAIATPSSYQTNLVVAGDAYIVLFNTNGIRQWGTYYGDNGVESAKSCAFDAMGNVFAVGETTSPNNLASVGSHQTIYGGNNGDAYVVKFRNCPSFNPTITVNSLICEWTNVLFNVTTNTLVVNSIWIGPNSFTSAITNPTILNISLAGSGVYSLTTNYGLGCTEKSTVSINVNPTPTISVNSGQICVGNTFTLFPTGANTYTVQGGNSIVSPTISTTYTVIGTSSAGCMSQAYVTSTVVVNSLPTLAVNSGSICSGSNFTIVPNGASTYTFSSSGPIVSPIVNTTYSVTGTSTAGCVGINTAICNVTVESSPTITAVLNPSVICSGKSVTLQVSGADTYSWSNTATNSLIIVSPTISTTYSVIGTNTNSCSDYSSINVTVNPSPTVSIVGNYTICSGQSSTLNANGATNYTWSNSSTNTVIIVSPLSNTGYSVVGFDANGCSDSSYVNISVDPNPTVTILDNFLDICRGQAITISVMGANSYTWSTNAISNSITVSPSVTTSYTVTGENAFGCTSSLVLTVTVNDCTGSTELKNSNNGIVVYPNPATTELKIKMSSSFNARSIALFNSIGQVIKYIEITDLESRIDLSQLANGIYFSEVGFYPYLLLQ